jgi:hypothetical protein
LIIHSRPRFPVHTSTANMLQQLQCRPSCKQPQRDTCTTFKAYSNMPGAAVCRPGPQLVQANRGHVVSNAAATEAAVSSQTQPINNAPSDAAREVLFGAAPEQVGDPIRPPQPRSATAVRRCHPVLSAAIGCCIALRARLACTSPAITQDPQSACSIKNDANSPLYKFVRQCVQAPQYVEPACSLVPCTHLTGLGS